MNEIKFKIVKIRLKLHANLILTELGDEQGQNIIYILELQLDLQVNLFFCLVIPINLGEKLIITDLSNLKRII